MRANTACRSPRAATGVSLVSMFLAYWPHACANPWEIVSHSCSRRCRSSSEMAICRYCVRSSSRCGAATRSSSSNASSRWALPSGFDASSRMSRAICSTAATGSLRATPSAHTRSDRALTRGSSRLSRWKPKIDCMMTRTNGPRLKPGQLVAMTAFVATPSRPVTSPPG